MSNPLREFGFELELLVYVNSPTKGLDGEVKYTLPKHQVPTKESINSAIKAAVQQANESAGTDDFEVVTLEDRTNFATPSTLRWDFD